MTHRDPTPYAFELLNVLRDRQRFEYTPAQIGSSDIDTAVDEWLMGIRLRKGRREGLI